MKASTKNDEAPAKRQEAVVALIELRNFTRMSEMLEPPKVLELASEFFSLAARVVEEREGEVFAVQNDSVLAAFRTGTAEQFTRQAMLAAQAIQREFGLLEETWHNDYGLQAAVALGLHRGEAVFGTAGPEGDRRFVVFGDTVSIAERLAHRARAGEFVFSEPLFGVLGQVGLELKAEALPALVLPRRPSIPIQGVLLDTRLDFT
jgi:adenylate cyclase